MVLVLLFWFLWRVVGFGFLRSACGLLLLLHLDRGEYPDSKKPAVVFTLAGFYCWLRGQDLAFCPASSALPPSGPLMQVQLARHLRPNTKTAQTSWAVLVFGCGDRI
ncbi:hypothetical protein [Aminobacter aminovorans]|uniref:hypothetical protein n=1 Tax=Aminobacter aminovorans TaxID=83263 RepID=UPI0011C0776E|nr:hypothetical protein [Aminobacter aminovorans]